MSVAAGMNILPFTVADQHGGIPLENVRQVVRATEITSLPSAPNVIEGVIDLHGEIVPVVDLRGRFGLVEKSTELSDRFIIAQAGDLVVALHADAVDTVLAAELKMFGTKAAGPVSEELGIAGATSLPDGMTLIYDLEAFFTASERDAVQSALAERMS